jgi:squalene-associated FAD-dependent desaturase
MNAAKHQRVAVIGGGWAGIAAATQLAESGFSVTLFEASQQLGGRAKSVEWNTSDKRTIKLDNGQHILSGAYRSTLALMTQLGIAPDQVLKRMPMTVFGTNGLVVRAPRLVAPLHLLVALLTAKGLRWSDRFLAMQLMQTAKNTHWRLDSDCSVSQWLLRNKQSYDLRKKIWEPLCVATLNTPAPLASAQVFLNVLRDTLGASRSDSDFLIPSTHLGALLPEVALRRLGRQAKIRLGRRVTAVIPQEQGIQVHQVHHGEQRQQNFDAAVLAVSALHLPELLGETRTLQPEFDKLIRQCEALSWQSITTVYLLYPQTPFKKGQPAMVMLDDDPANGAYGQWVFDRQRLGGEAGLVAVVISADGPHRQLSRAEVIACVVLQLRKQMGANVAPIDSRLIIEKRATFACTPGLQRPGGRTPDPRLVLAGDYTMSDYPATLEAAVRSGFSAANYLNRELA